jgi:hypothetical protein
MQTEILPVLREQWRDNESINQNTRKGNSNDRLKYSNRAALRGGCCASEVSLIDRGVRNSTFCYAVVNEV